MKKKLNFLTAIIGMIFISIYTLNINIANAQEPKSETPITNKSSAANNIEQKSSYALYKNEINKRFNGGEWEKDLTKLSERALIQEYVRIIGISNHLASMNIEKKQRIEALLATYTSMQLQSKMKAINGK